MKPSSNLDYNIDLSQVTTYQVGVSQAAVHRIIQKVCDEYLDDFGLTKMHWILVGTILDAGSKGIRITELALKLHTGLPYLTTTINNLESKEILTRISDPKDTRAKFVCVDSKFAKKCPKIEHGLRNHLRNIIYSKVSPEEFKNYILVLDLLSQTEDVE